MYIEPIDQMLKQNFYKIALSAGNVTYICEEIVDAYDKIINIHHNKKSDTRLNPVFLFKTRAIIFLCICDLRIFWFRNNREYIKN